AVTFAGRVGYVPRTCRLALAPVHRPGRGGITHLDHQRRRSPGSFHLSFALKGTAPMDAGGQDAPRVLLLHPPYADYTCPYHSLSYVAAPLRAQGYAVDVFDINAIWFRQVFTAQKVATWSQTLTARLAEWDQMDDLSVDQQIQLTSDIRALAACRSLEPQRAVDILRGAQFYDPASYRWAQDQVRTFEKLLDKFYAPYGFSQAFAIAPHEPNSKRLLDKAAGCHDMIAD